MSIIKVNSVTSVNETDRVNFPAGASLGIGSATGMNISGVVTAATASLGSGAVTANTSGVNVSGAVTATNFYGDGSGLTNINVYQSGQYNSGISTAVLYDLTTSAGVAYTVASGVGTQTKYVVHSIHLTNIATADVTVTATAYTSDYSIGYAVPLPQRTSVELLRKPKVLTAGHFIRLQASSSNSIKAIITAEQITDLAGDFFGQGTTCTAADTYYDLTSFSYATMVRSLLLANKNDTFDTRATVVLTDSGNTLLTYYAYELIVPANSTVELFETEKFVAATQKLRVLSTAAATLDATVSGRRVYTVG